MVSWEQRMSDRAKQRPLPPWEGHVGQEHSWVVIERDKHAKLLECSGCGRRHWSMPAVAIELDG